MLELLFEPRSTTHGHTKSLPLVFESFMLKYVVLIYCCDFPMVQMLSSIQYGNSRNTGANHFPAALHRPHQHEDAHSFSLLLILLKLGPPDTEDSSWRGGHAKYVKQPERQVALCSCRVHTCMHAACQRFESPVLFVQQQMWKEVDKQQQVGTEKPQGQQQGRQTRKTNEGLAAAFGGISILTAILGVAILFFTNQVCLLHGVVIMQGLGSSRMMWHHSSGTTGPLEHISTPRGIGISR